MNVLVLNCGSSSVKFQLIQTDLEAIEQDSDRRLAWGVLERIGSRSLITFQSEGHDKVRRDAPVRDYRSAIEMLVRWIVSGDSQIAAIGSAADVHAVGHRVVHGGERFRKSVLIDDDVLEGIEECMELAPLHNPANLRGIREVRELLGVGVPQVAVFDTAFHATMPEVAYLYGLPYQYYRRHRIRRYGFHGTSHRYIAYRYRQIRGVEKTAVNLITLHLGNGCSACAIKNGESIDTSMGFTPLEGLLMATRCGDIDASLIEYLSNKEGLTLVEIDGLLNKQSGLLGLSGITGDMRELLDEEAENQDRRARLAIDIFCRRVRKYIGAYHVEIGGADAVAFGGGIGENSAAIRKRICRGLDAVGLWLDEERNQSASSSRWTEISTPESRLKAYVIPTNEELLIARDTVRVISDVPRTF